MGFAVGGSACLALPIRRIQQSTCSVPRWALWQRVEVLQATAPMAPSIGYDWLVDGFSLLRGGRKIDFSSCGPSKNRVLDGIVIDASAQGMVGMTSLGWQSVTLSTKGLGGRHGWGAGRHYVPTTRLRHAQKSGWEMFVTTVFRSSRLAVNRLSRSSTNESLPDLLRAMAFVVSSSSSFPVSSRAITIFISLVQWRSTVFSREVKASPGRLSDAVAMLAPPCRSPLSIVLLASPCRSPMSVSPQEEDLRSCLSNFCALANVQRMSYS